jgi:hypothetical protein
VIELICQLKMVSLKVYWVLDILHLVFLARPKSFLICLKLEPKVDSSYVTTEFKVVLSEKVFYQIFFKLAGEHKNLSGIQGSPKPSSIRS